MLHRPNDSPRPRRGPWMLVALLALLPGRSGADADLPDTVARLERSTVALIAFEPKRPTVNERYDIQGGGCFVSADGHVLTADHVLRRIIQPEGHVRRSADVTRLAIGWLPDPDGTDATIVTNLQGNTIRVVRRDAGRDLALLHVHTEHVQPITLSSSEERPGTDIAFLGFPFGTKLGFRPLVNRGTIAGRRQLPGRAKDIPGFRGYILDGSVHPGHSGSPVFDTRTGVVLGLVQRRFTQTIPLAIASPDIIAFLREAGVTPATDDD